MKGILLTAAAMAAIGSLAAPAQAEVVIGPRFSYYFDNSNLRTSDLDGVADARPILSPESEQIFADLLGEPVSASETGFSSSVLAEQIAFPMFGGMINFGNDRDRFTLVGMYGSGSGKAEVIATRSAQITFSGGTVRDLEVQTLVGGSEVDRVDIEATWQRRLNENIALTGGLRYERLDVTDVARFEAVGTDQILVVALDDPSAPLRSLPGRLDIEAKSTIETFSARFGATAFVPVDRSINAFFSGLIQAGYQPDTSQNLTTSFPDNPQAGSFDETQTSNGEISVGPDMAVGAQFLLTENLALDVRYRAIVFFPLSGDFDFGDARVNHGVNFGLSLRL